MYPTQLVSSADPLQPLLLPWHWKNLSSTWGEPEFVAQWFFENQASLESTEWFIEDQAFLAVVWFDSSPTPFPSLPSATCLSFAVFPCVAGRPYCWERGKRRGWASSEIILPRESLTLCKSFNTRCWSPMSSKFLLQYGSDTCENLLDQHFSDDFELNMNNFRLLSSTWKLQYFPASATNRQEIIFLSILHDI